MNSVIAISAICVFLLGSALSVSGGTWSDGFEEPDLDEWKIHLQAGNQPVWEIENGLLLAEQSGSSGVWIGNNTWEDYSVEVTVILLEYLPLGPATPDSHGAAIFMYSRIAPFQKHFYGVGIRLFDGRGPGLFAGTHNGWRAPIVLEHKAQEIRFGREYKLRMTEEKNLIKCYLDGELVLELKMDKRFRAGVVGLYIVNAKAYFDDFVVDGARIPNGGLGLGKAVKPKAGVATTWAHVKQQ